SIILVALVIAYKQRVMLFFVLAAYTLSGPVITLYRMHAKRAAASQTTDGALPPTQKEPTKTGENRISQ
ncbi:MAG: hypothetical protein JRI80_15495, partial [Deltaproteobacteria bacterium]|nr:hypothetical protein [Deltaproteobacteria bacterium]